MEIVRAAQARRFRRNRAEYEARAMRLLRDRRPRRLRATSYPWQLSGGMQQRSNLCRALIHEPELLMLDEPFGALDAFTREELWGVMQALWLEKRFTGVLVTHDLREAVYLADTVYVMSRRPGRIVHDAQDRHSAAAHARHDASSRISSTSSTSCATASRRSMRMSDLPPRGAAASPCRGWPRPSC